jgi:hypothetical protein
MIRLKTIASYDLSRNNPHIFFKQWGRIFQLLNNELNLIKLKSILGDYNDDDGDDDDVVNYNNNNDDDDDDDDNNNDDDDDDDDDDD